jgi:hypothetical protein
MKQSTTNYALLKPEIVLEVAVFQPGRRGPILPFVAAIAIVNRSVLGIERQGH